MLAFFWCCCTSASSSSSPSSSSQSSSSSPSSSSSSPSSSSPSSSSPSSSSPSSSSPSSSSPSGGLFCDCTPFAPTTPPAPGGGTRYEFACVISFSPLVICVCSWDWNGTAWVRVYPDPTSDCQP